MIINDVYVTMKFVKMIINDVYVTMYLQLYDS